MDDSSNPHIHDYKRRLSQDSSESDRLSVKVAKYYAKRASYSAKQAEYEALKSEYEEQKMEYAVRLAEIERDRDNLAIKKLELELELNRVKDKRT
jgi:uncharacterized protein YeeX (DUF496 family)